MTTTYAGTQVKLKLERLTAEGKIIRQYIGTLDGGAADISFPTPRFPITTGAGATTDDETEVDVYTDDGTPGSWTEYSDAGADFTIVGATGVVTILAAKNQAGNSGERISISYFTTEEPAVGQDVSIEYAQELEEVYKLGSTDPQELKEKGISISLAIGVLYTDRSLMGTFLGQQDFYKKLAAYSFYLYPNGETTGQPQIKMTGVKFSGGTLTVDTDSILALNVTAKGLATELGSVPA